MSDLLISNLPSIVCFIGATVLAFKQVDGWGWLIFAGIILVSSIKIVA